MTKCLRVIRRLYEWVSPFFSADVYFARHPGGLPDDRAALIFLPLNPCALNCGLAGIVSLKAREIERSCS